MLRSFLKKSSLVKKIKWEVEYLLGKWNFLSSPMEADRLQVIIELMKKYCVAKPSVLEVGSGEGQFQKQLVGFPYNFFTGIELSSVAVRKAVSHKFENTRYEVADMNTWDTKKSFDVVVFNESIYYAEDPVELIDKYSRWLTPEGRLILSIYRMPATLALEENILKSYTPLSSREIKNDQGTWCDYIFAFPQMV